MRRGCFGCPIYRCITWWRRQVLPAWYHVDIRIPYHRPEADLALPSSLGSLLPVGYPNDTQTLSTTSWAWHKLVKLTDFRMLYSSALPVAGNGWIPILQEALVKRTLTKFHLVTFGDLFSKGHVFSRTEEPHFRDATVMDHFILQSALRAAVHSYPLEPPEFPLLTGIIKDGDGTHLVTRLYKAAVALLPSRDVGVRGAW